MPLYVPLGTALTSRKLLFTIESEFMIIELNYSYQFRANERRDLKSLVECESCKLQRSICKYHALTRPTHLCSSCATNNRNGEKKRKTIKDYHALAELRDFKFISDVIPITVENHGLWECFRKHIWSATFANIKSGYGCPICYGRTSKLSEDYEMLAGNLGVQFIGPKPKRVNIQTKWKCKCESVFLRSYNKMKAGHGLCPDCTLVTYSGANSYLYNPNLTDAERYESRQDRETYEWRQDIYKLFSHACFNCGATRCMVIAHHIFNWNDHPKLRHFRENGVCLCRPCHINFHSRYGKKNNSLGQLELFLKKPLPESQRDSLLKIFQSVSGTGI